MNFNGSMFRICGVRASMFCTELEPEPKPSGRFTQDVLLRAGAGAEMLYRSRSPQKFHASASLSVDAGRFVLKFGLFL